MLDVTVTAASLGLSEHQFINAKGIIAAVKARNWNTRAAVIAVETALAESGMHIIASYNVPSSRNFPHDLLTWTYDGLGHDHASCGMFQQQTGWAWCLPGTTTMGSANGWGTPAELMSAEKSTAKFLDALSRRNWQIGTRWAAAQSVQGSAISDGSNYRLHDDWAYQIVTALWGGLAVTPVTHTPAGATSKPLGATYKVCRGDTLSAIAAKHHTTWQVLMKLNKLANPNKIKIGQVLRLPGGGVVTPVAKKYRIVGSYTVRRGDSLVGICHGYPQAWITPTSVAHLNAIKDPNKIRIGQVLRIGG